MEGRKRKRLGQNFSPRTDARDDRTDPPIYFDLLPIELEEIILEIATQYKHDKHPLWITAIVCRFVCRRWRDLLPKQLPAKWYLRTTAATLGLQSLLTWAIENGSPDKGHASFHALRKHKSEGGWVALEDRFSTN